jgi:alanyl-tRNA synthetase
MTRISDSTIVTFPSGATDGESVVLDLVHLHDEEVVPDRTVLVTRETPFHPVDHQWPDQPGDSGLIETSGCIFEVADSIVGAVADGSDTIFVGASVPVRRGEPGWHWLVLHVLSTPPPDLPQGSTVVLRVNRTRRSQLSVAHTACHLSGFALNETLKEGWRKSPPADSLGNPDFDSVALTQSRISTHGFHDIYRIGRTMRKQGFDRDFLFAALPSLSEEITSCIHRWLDFDGKIRLLRMGTMLSDMRIWECDLPQGTARVACGGTHPHSIGALREVNIVTELSSDGTELQVTAQVSSTGDAGIIQDEPQQESGPLRTRDAN